MPRKPKESSSLSVSPVCIECDKPVVDFDVDGFGLCEMGHGGQPVPDGWKPVPIQNKNPMRHEFAVDMLWLADLPEDEARSDDDDPCEHCGQKRSEHTTAANRAFLQEHIVHFCDCGHSGLGHFEGGACWFIVNDEHCGCTAFLWEQDGKAAQPALIEIAPELHEGRAVISHEAAISGAGDISRYRVAANDWWASLRIGMSGTVMVSYEVVGDGFKPEKKEGIVIGLKAVRKLKLGNFILPETDDVTEGLPLWTDGVVNPEPASEAVAGFVDDMLADADDVSPLAESLAEAGVE